MKKRILSIALALALCLGLAVPAFAAPEDWDLDIPGKTEEDILMGERTFVLRNWNSDHNVDEDTVTYTKKAETENYTVPFVARVQKGDTIVITNKQGSEFALTLYAWSDPDGDGVYDSRMYELKWDNPPVGKHDHETLPADFAGPLVDDCVPLYGPYDNAYWLGDDGACSGPAGYTTKVSVPAETLYNEFGSNTFLTISPEEGVAWWLLLEEGGGASSKPAAPAQPSQPVTPDAPGTYTVKKWDTWSIICTNFYGTNAQRYALMKANKSVKLTEGTIITLPEKLGKDILIPAPVCAEGEKLYTVKAGDTLGKIALAEYGSMAQYKAIFERNSDRLANANMIYEGQVIVLPVISK